MSTKQTLTLTEDVLGKFGFRVVWSYAEHWSDVVAYEITGYESSKPLFNRKNWNSLPDPVESIDDAEPYLGGFIKWDGCAELSQGCPHWCGLNSFKKHCDLLKYLYCRARELMNTEESEPWPL